MQRCANCNAPFGDDLEACTYCGRVTEQGAKARKQREAMEQKKQLEAQQLAAAQAIATRAQIDNKARSLLTQSYLWSLLGTFFCFLPVGPMVGLFCALKVRRLDKSHTLSKSPIPALVLSIGATALTSALWLAVAGVGIAEASRKSELNELIAREASNPTLSHEVACALLERELLVTNYEGYDQLNEEFVCSAEPTQTGDRAKLAAHFLSSGKKVHFTACMERAPRWEITRLDKFDLCDAPDGAGPEEEELDAPPAAPATATLSLTTTPAADVYLGSTRLGRTPLDKVTIPAGEQTLQLKWGKQSRYVRTSLDPGADASFKLRLSALEKLGASPLLRSERGGKLGQ